MRVLLDANMLVRANTRATGPARELLERIRSNPGHELVLSRYILAEVKRALRYPRLQSLYSLTESDIEEHVRALEEAATIVEPVISDPIVRRDPADDPVLFAAVEGRVEVLCTKDRDFYDPEVIAFCRRHGIEVMNDLDLLQRLRVYGTNL